MSKLSFKEIGHQFHELIDIDRLSEIAGVTYVKTFLFKAFHGIRG